MPNEGHVYFRVRHVITSASGPGSEENGLACDLATLVRPLHVHSGISGQTGGGGRGCVAPRTVECGPITGRVVCDVGAN